jgi:hypothetical protein
LGLGIREVHGGATIRFFGDFRSLFLPVATWDSQDTIEASGLVGTEHHGKKCHVLGLLSGALLPLRFT